MVSVSMIFGILNKPDRNSVELNFDVQKHAIENHLKLQELPVAESLFVHLNPALGHHHFLSGGTPEHLGLHDFILVLVGHNLCRHFHV